jgi:predicted  nucleic acid-binding Zn-ribbon protein
VVLKLLEEKEVLTKKSAQLEADFSGIETKYADQEKEIEKINSEVDAKTASLRAQRTEMAKEIDKSLVARYDQIFTRREGRAVVAVKGEVCLGCDMGVPPQIVNFARSGEQGIQNCPHCSRILYWEASDAKAATAEKPKAKRGGRKKKDAPAAEEGDEGGDDAAAEKQ